MIHRAFAVASLSLCFALTAHAQDPAWSDTTGCVLQADAARLKVSLPLELIDHLERTSSSEFVHAFLIGLIADPDAGGHRLSRCARSFIGASPTALGTMRRNLPSARTILQELREAEQTRRNLLHMADSLHSFSALVTRLRSDTTQVNLDVAWKQVAKLGCEQASNVICSTFKKMEAQVDTVRSARDALSRATDAARQAAVSQSSISADLQAPTASLMSDSTSFLQYRAASVNDTVSIRSLTVRLVHWHQVIDSLKASLAKRDTLVAMAALAREAALVVARDAARRLGETLARVDTQLTITPARLDTTLTIFRSVAVGVRTSALAPSTVEGATANPALPSANLMLALTDFILSRARREVVNSFVVNLYDLGLKEPLLHQAFPDTWGLMNGLRKRSDGRLNAVDVGRISLTTWRATLAEDFVSLPATLLESGPVALCGSSAPVAASDTALLKEYRNSCQERAATLMPLAPITRRLLEGDAVFDILRDANTFAPPSGPHLPLQWIRVSQGLTILSTLTDAYVIQGQSLTADPLQHPYMLTARSLSRVSQRQRDAFLRLLLVRAFAVRSDVPSVVHVTDLLEAVDNTTRVVERIGSHSPSDTGRTAALQVVRSSFDALAGAAELGRAFESTNASNTLRIIAKRWRLVGGMIEPLVSHDFGLALARTTAMLQEIRNDDVPNSVILVSSLAASLSEAKDGEHVRLAFEAAASPVGGWQAKRYGEGGTSITAFPGLAVGAERVLRQGTDDASISDYAWTLGLSLPVGIEWLPHRSAAEGRAYECSWIICGVGLMIPIVDLGALLNYRISKTGSVQTEPNATFRQVFAPGAYMSVPLFRTVPATMLAGAQLMPALRKVETNGGIVSRSALRFGVSIGLDVMLLGF